MRLSELKTVLESTGYPVAYGAFPEDDAPALPCITYEAAYTNNFGADTKVYKKVTHVDIFLWTNLKDETAEGKVETALNNAFLFWQNSESFVDSEEAYQIIYEVEIENG